jgi:predicted alpha/beta superfamily hydrolase
MNRRTQFVLVLIVATLALPATGLDAQRGRGAPPGGPGGPGRGARATAGTIERITVHGKALEAGRALDGNGQGDSPDRAVAVYLPPSYAGDQNRRFPTVYLLHGVNGTESAFIDGSALQASADRLAGAQGFSEFIVVTPDASTQKGGMYTSSPAADWERFIAEDLVGYVDSHYRTLAHRMSRGLAGYDAGGSGALRIGMKRPEVFANLYVMSASGDAIPSSDLEKYASNLNAYYGIAMDIGAADPMVERIRQLHTSMTKARIAHLYEEYDGDHSNRLRDRIEWNVLPFFARNLAAPANLTSPSAAADRLSDAGKR